MTTPILYLVIPSILAFVLFFLRKKPGLSVILSMSIYFLLGLLALFHPFGEVLKIGVFSIEIGTSVNVFGRGFILSNPDRYFLFLLCLTAVLTIGGIRQVQTAVHDIPYLMLVLASLTAALAVDPFLYSAIFVEIATLLSMPILIKGKESLSKGVLRFLIFQSLAMPLILVGGWFITGSQTNPSDLQQLGITGLFLATGFAFWLAVFPFHSWVPQFSEDVHPYISGFILTVIPQTALLLILDFSNSITWIRESGQYRLIILTIGIIMLVAAAIWGYFEKIITRFTAYLVLFETGCLLILSGLQTIDSMKAFYLSLVPRLISILMTGFCLSIIYGNQKSSHTEISEVSWKYPIASMGLIISLFSLVGFPLIGEFPYKYILLTGLGENHPQMVVWIVVGFITMLIPIYNLIRRVFIIGNKKLEIHESMKQIFIISVGVLLLLLIGVYPKLLDVIFSQLTKFLPVVGQ
jgi:NADH-quinone oxidoreductase subunit N